MPTPKLHRTLAMTGKCDGCLFKADARTSDNGYKCDILNAHALFTPCTEFKEHYAPGMDSRIDYIWILEEVK